jgi:hypothetical protein
MSLLLSWTVLARYGDIEGASALCQVDGPGK